MKITAAVVERAGAPCALQDVDLGYLRADEVLVEVAEAGICHADLIRRHEFFEYRWAAC